MDQNRKLLIALIAASTALGLIILFMIFFWICQRKRLDKDNNHTSDVVKGIALPVTRKFNSLKSTYSRKSSFVSLMEYKTLESATNKFQESEILGEGVFGCVYKAKLEDNLYVAVKKLQGGTHDAIKEFETEVELLSQMQHPNIISLLGYCIHSETRLLVYELMQNGSLETQLHGKLTDKSDVYAFGVVLLELLLGRRPVEKVAPTECQSIVTWAMPQLTDRSKLPNIVDPVIQNTMDLKHLYQVAAVAVLCVQPEASYRPLITDVLHSLIPLVPTELGGTLRVATQQHMLMPSET